MRDAHRERRALTVLASSQPMPLGDVVGSDNYVYFASSRGIHRVAKNGGSALRARASLRWSLS
jgi:hypothetical protein